jgi:hypothetical protein
MGSRHVAQKIKDRNPQVAETDSASSVIQGIRQGISGGGRDGA